MATVSPEDCWSYSLTLPHDPRSAHVARVTLRAVVQSHGLTHLADVTELVASELVANTYLHSDGPAEIRLRRVGAECVRISVWDTNPDIPEPFARPVRLGKGRVPAVDVEAAGGRGLLIVRRLAEAWGSWSAGRAFPGVPGKMLWCEVGRQ
ncbi:MULTISPECIES: ATP-binding protein [Streptomyces]